MCWLSGDRHCKSRVEGSAARQAVVQKLGGGQLSKRWLLQRKGVRFVGLEPNEFAYSESPGGCGGG
jgi:hypothetical protein